MSYIKVPSWIELVLLGLKLPGNYLFGSTKTQNSQPFWKEQTLRFGFDIREAEDILWQCFFYEKFFKYTLKRIDNNLQNLKAWEKNFWRRNGRFVERLELTSINQQDFELMASWFPNLKYLTLKRCNTLLQTNCSFLTSLKKLITLEIRDTHLISEKTFANIPEQLHTLIIHSAKSITNDFFDYLPNLKELTSLSLVNCQSLELCQLSKLPPELVELDISDSGKQIRPDACFLLPRSLTSLKMNRWEHFQIASCSFCPNHLLL